MASAAKRVRWADVLDEGRQIMRTYKTGVTLRQLFYRLVSKQIIPNTQAYYTTLSARTAEARRAGEFPEFIDETRQIHRPLSFESSQAAMEWLRDVYRRDRTDGQEYLLYLGVEKKGLVTYQFVLSQEKTERDLL
jgi:hypothetical protein